MREPSTDNALATTGGVKLIALWRRRWPWAAVFSAIGFLGAAAGYGYRDRVSVGSSIAAATQEISRVETDSIQRDALAGERMKFIEREVYFTRLDVRAGGMSPLAPPPTRPSTKP